ncbi:27494_t:CDS:2 [Gigaspora margarita]|uniref:27494_t:CDS:1 n=1 Tax=Gigaspora margarita TaxID=4874 RepID=A0ABN7UQJ2_GIGMA|nr:27494_t:CDS:2 [Gigaspora margarita]
MSSTCVAESSSSTSLAPITVNASVSTDVPIAITIPPEIFIKICEHLPPSDLLSLTGVCKRFRGFLCSPESLITQDIWRTSRIYFLPGLQLPPPEGMYEEEYIRFASLLTRCQYCTSQKMVKVYWQFQSSYREFEVISGNHYMKWVADRKERRIRIMDDAVQRSATADTTTNISTVSALGVDVDPRQFALSQIRITGTRSSVSSAVSALQHFGHIDTLDIMIMDSP